MKTLIARPLVGLAAWWLDDTVAVEKLHAWMCRTAGALGGSHASLADAARDDLLTADRLLRASAAVPGWPALDLHDADDVERDAERTADDDGSRAWMTGRGGGSVVVKGVVARGTGRHLARLVHERDDPAVDAFVWEALDKLLRHVEVRRRDALMRYEPAASAVDATLERLDIATLFARVARLDRDVRFLNAAMKLNDWAFPGLSKVSPASDARPARFLRALAEQEACAKELLS